MLVMTAGRLSMSYPCFPLIKWLTIVPATPHHVNARTRVRLTFCTPSKRAVASMVQSGASGLVLNVGGV